MTSMFQQNFYFNFEFNHQKSNSEYNKNNDDFNISQLKVDLMPK